MSDELRVGIDLGEGDYFTGKIHCHRCDNTYSVTQANRQHEYTRCPVCMRPNSTLVPRDENGDSIDVF